MLIAEQLDTIAKSTDFMLACEPNTPRASGLAAASTSHVEPPSPMHPTSATSSNLYAVVTPGGPLTARTSDSQLSLPPLPTGPSTAHTFIGPGTATATATATPRRSGATVFESALVKEEMLEQFGYYPDTQPGVSDPGRERWLMLTTEFDTPQGLAGPPPGPFSRHSYGEGSSNMSLESSAHESSRARSTQFAHFARSPSQHASSASKLSARRQHPGGPRSGLRSGPSSYNTDAVMLQQLRDDFHINGGPQPSARSAAFPSPRSRIGLSTGPKSELSARGTPVGAAQLSTIEGTSGDVSAQGQIDTATSPPASTGYPASREVWSIPCGCIASAFVLFASLPHVEGWGLVYFLYSSTQLPCSLALHM